MSNLDKMYKPEGIGCPKCKSKDIREYDSVILVEDDEGDLVEDTSYLFTCNECGHNF